MVAHILQLELILYSKQSSQGVLYYTGNIRQVPWPSLHFPLTLNSTVWSSLISVCSLLYLNGWDRQTGRCKKKSDSSLYISFYLRQSQWHLIMLCECSGCQMYSSSFHRSSWFCPFMIYFNNNKMFKFQIFSALFECVARILCKLQIMLNSQINVLQILV